MLQVTGLEHASQLPWHVTRKLSLRLGLVYGWV
jgi:hypothetical protein